MNGHAEGHLIRLRWLKPLSYQADKIIGNRRTYAQPAASPKNELLPELWTRAGQGPRLLLLSRQAVSFWEVAVDVITPAASDADRQWSCGVTTMVLPETRGL